MIKNIFDNSGKRKTNAVQIDTRVSSLQKTGADFSLGASQPVFPKSEDHIFDMFRDSDHLFKSFDPIVNEQEQKQRELSATNAENINPLINDLNNGN